MSVYREANRIVQFLKKTLADSGLNGYALGLSGGIDSAVCAALAKRAIDELHREGASSDDKTYTLDLIKLPINSSPQSLDIADDVASSLGMEARTVGMTDAFQAFIEAQGDIANTPDVAKYYGNIKARMRMTAIYFAANAKGLLVLGTDNWAETYTGYFTKHGDGAADVFPLSRFTKREVYELGRFLGLPDSVLKVAPSADLWQGQTDESEMGVPYDFIDNYLEGMNDVNEKVYGAKYKGYRNRLRELNESTQHKRDAPHIYERDAK